jgi:hypothetical protein
MTWVDDLFTTGASLGAQWTTVTPDGTVTYPATGGSSVHLASNNASDSIWTDAANATRIEQDVSGAGDFEIYTAILDVPAEAGIFVRGATITSDFVKFGRYGSQFTFAWCAGGVADFRNGSVAGTYPIALRLVRTGNSWTAFYAMSAPADDPDAVSWTQFDTAHTAAFTPAAAGLYNGGNDGERFDYAVSTLASAEVGATMALSGGAGALAMTAKRTVYGAVAAAGGAGVATLSAARTVHATAALGASAGVLALTGSNGGELKHASTTLVALAWLRTIAGLPANSAGVKQVAATLPALERWKDTGFVSLGPVFGSARELYTPLEHPVVQLDFWAVHATSKKAHYGLANELAEIVREAIDLTTFNGVPEVTMPVGVRPVWLSSIYSVSGVRDIPDPNNYAHYAMDVHIGWIEREALAGVTG